MKNTLCTCIEIIVASNVGLEPILGLGHRMYGLLTSMLGVEAEYGKRLEFEWAGLSAAFGIHGRGRNKQAIVNRFITKLKRKASSTTRSLTVIAARQMVSTVVAGDISVAYWQNIAIE